MIYKYASRDGGTRPIAYKKGCAWTNTCRLRMAGDPTLMEVWRDAKLSDVRLAVNDLKTRLDESTARLENLNEGVVCSLDDIKSQLDLATLKLIKMDEKMGLVLSFLQRDAVMGTVVACTAPVLPVITEIVHFPLEPEEHV